MPELKEGTTDAAAFWARTSGTCSVDHPDARAVDAAMGPATDWYVVPASVARSLESALTASRQQVAELTERQKWLDEVGPPAHPDDERHWAMAYVNARKQVAALMSRLEMDVAYDGAGNVIPAPEGMPDGIACRDETIRLQRQQAEQLTEERNAVEQQVVELDTDNAALRAQVEQLTRERNTWRDEALHNRTFREQVGVAADQRNAAESLSASLQGQLDDYKRWAEAWHDAVDYAARMLGLPNALPTPTQFCEQIHAHATSLQERVSWHSRDATPRFPQQALDAPSGQGCSEQRSRRDHD